MSEVLAERLPDAFIARGDRHPRRRRRRAPLRQARGADRADRPHRRAALARLGRERAADRLRRQRQRHAQPARGGARARARRPVHLLLDQQGLRRHAQPPAARGARGAPGAARGPRVLRRHPDTSMSIDGSTHSLFGVSKAAADLLVQEYGRYFGMPTVCFRGGCLTGPNHAGTQLHGFLSYLMRCTITGQPVHRVRLRRQAGARQHPLRRPRRAPSRRSRRRRAPRRSTTSAAGARATARCSRRSRICEEIAGPQARLDLHRREPHRRPPLVDLRPRRRSSATIPSGRCATRSRTSCARSTTRTWSTGPRREPLGRHPGAQRGGGRRADAARADRPARARGDRLRDRRRRRRLVATGPRDVVAARDRRGAARALRAQRGAQRLRLRGPQGARGVHAATPS